MITADTISALLRALTFQGGFNTGLVTLGAMLLGLAAGGAGTFLLLRGRALVSDAISHAALPGAAAGFLIMAAMGYDGRWLPGLLLGAAVSAGIGLVLVDRAVRFTRLAEDAAIGAVLSVFFGLGIVLLTIIQGLPWGKAAGLSGFLLGSAAGMLQSEAWAIAGAGALACLAVFALRRPLTLVSFDPGFAQAQGLPLALVDMAMMGIALVITVIGLKVAGVVLIVALLIIPPAAARFWTDDVGTMAVIAAGIGGVSGHMGAALSAAGPALPTGPLIVLSAFALFVISMLFAPRRGAVAAVLARRAFAHRVHRRQGLLALSRGEPIYDGASIRILKRARLIRGDLAPTDAGRIAAAQAARDEARWRLARRIWEDEALAGAHDALLPIESTLTADQIADLDARMKPEACA
ncbi:MAG: manganese/zinc/iron transport system permease protein [Paracoccaceae bacterium]|jgi:manganese/zinc/iron transport system permease protein